jgi:hypothetical protein
MRQFLFSKYTYESGIPPGLKNINSSRFCRVMKTVVILALIVAVCMCSGGDASGMVVEPGEGEEDKLSPSAGGETADTSDPGEKSGRDGENPLTKSSDRMLEEKVNEPLGNCYDGEFHEDFFRSVIGPEVYRTLCRECREEAVNEEVTRVPDVVDELEKDPVTIPDLSVNPESGSHNSGNNQNGVDGVQKQGKEKQKKKEKKLSGATAGLSKSGEVDSKAVQGGRQKKKRSILGCIPF